jgi:NADH dehydrogenase [ubiquinone] 1 alpha subcomplex assembly factor 7
MNIADRIRREGPIPFDVYMEAALYGEGGFFASGNGARRDFVTSPEVGSLFGMCIARALDRYWRELGEPDPFLVVEAGAGNGRLAHDVLRAAPECLRALRYVLVERSAVLRAEQRTRLPIDPPDEALGPFVRRDGEAEPIPATGAGPVVAALEELPAIGAANVVVIANELLDNLPFGIADGDSEIRVGLDGDRLVEVRVPAADLVDAPVAGRAPIPRGIRTWFDELDGLVRHGIVVLIDYMTDDPALRLRTYTGHERGDDPLLRPGECDITADVVVPQLRAAAHAFDVVQDTTQAEWLRRLGIDDLADEGARAWREGAHRGDLVALAGRSHAHEASVLTDPAGLGAHRVLVLAR